MDDVVWAVASLFGDTDWPNLHLSKEMALTFRVASP